MSYLLSQPSPIPLHAISAIFAIILGGIQLLRPKGSVSHKWIGYIWVSIMMLVSISSFWIHSIQLFGLFSPIHLLSIFTIWTLISALLAARNNNIRKHALMMKLLYILGLILTGSLTLLPNRVMFQAIFG